MSINILDTIPDEFAKGYMAAKPENFFVVEHALVDMCNGNMTMAIMLSRIVHWHRNSDDTNKSKLRVKKDGHYWLAKNHNSWYDECRIPATTARRALKKLVNLNLIESMNTGFNGLRTPHHRIKWEEFSKQLKASSCENQNISDEKTPDDDEQTSKLDESKRPNWTDDESANVQIGQTLESANVQIGQTLESANVQIGQTVTPDDDEQTSKLDASNVQNEQTVRPNWTDDASKMDEPNTKRNTKKDTKRNTKRNTKELLSPGGDSDAHEKKSVIESSAEDEQAFNSLPEEAETKEPEKPEVTFEEWLTDTDAYTHAIAYAFKQKFSYKGFPAILRSQLMGITKTKEGKIPKRAADALDEPATPQEIWGFGAFYKDQRDGKTPTTASLLFERFEEFRGRTDYEKYVQIGEYHLRMKHNPTYVATENKASEFTEAQKLADEFMNNLIAPWKEGNRKRSNPESVIEMYEGYGKEIPDYVRELANAEPTDLGQ